MSEVKIKETIEFETEIHKHTVQVKKELGWVTVRHFDRLDWRGRPVWTVLHLTSGDAAKLSQALDLTAGDDE